MKCKGVIHVVALTVLLLSGGLWARPTTAYEAEMVVTGWMQDGFEPFGMTLGRQVVDVESFIDDEDRPVYYIVHLQPSGFVIVPADDSIEPIIGFADDGVYDPSFENPLGALVTSDLHGRVAGARDSFALQAELKVDTVDHSEGKWRDLIDRAENPQQYGLMGLVCVSDVRVIPLIQSEWGQTTACRLPSYNYYVPHQYPCGCLATAMAQVMRYFRYPSEGIGIHEFEITVDGLKQSAWTRGGDGIGGPYHWDDMMLRPTSQCTTFTQIHRQAIGAHCYDAGVAVNMVYESGGSSSFLIDGKDALLDTFQYDNAIMAYDSGRDISVHLKEIINPNLDAKAPVIFAIIDPNRRNSGHAVVCDGYGYESTTLYHHLNMGWTGIGDIWYNLPDIDSSKGRFASVFGCIYNIQITGNGEIVSGRVLDTGGQPIANVSVYADMGGQDPDTTVTDGRGIYAFVGLDPNTAYTVWPEAEGYVFSDRPVETGRSRNGVTSPGNQWGVDFYAESVLDPPPPDLIYVDTDAPGDPGPNDTTRSDLQEDGSPEHPFDAIQEAIDAAVSRDIVIILGGTYTGDGNRDLDYKGKAITVRSEDPNKLDLVIIDCQGSVEEPHRGFEFHSYEMPSSVLDGVTVVGGYYERGGAFYCKDCARPTVRNCNFDRNSASVGGAIYNESAGPTLTDCTFSRNTTEAGGAIYNYGELAACSPVLTGCVFYANTATYNGGAMYNLGQYAQPVLTNCTFIWNSVSIGGGGAIRNNFSAGMALTNCLFAKNSAALFGGAIRCSNGSSATITNCTLSNNSAGNGNALACTLDDGRLKSPCTVDILNCILWDGGDEIFNTDNSTIKVTYSNVEGGAGDGPWPGEGNIDIDPSFADPANGDYHLMSQAGRWNPKSQTWLLDKVTSPCIDAGDASTPIALEPSPNGGIINIGAYGGTPEASKSHAHP
ncbi:C10 family peptidase [Planctomycetota bacterium]